MREQRVPREDALATSARRTQPMRTVVHTARSVAHLILALAPYIRATACAVNQRSVVQSLISELQDVSLVRGL